MPRVLQKSSVLLCPLSFVHQSLLSLLQRTVLGSWTGTLHHHSSAPGRLTQQIADNKPPVTFSIILSSISVDNQLSEDTKREKQWNGYSRGLVILSFGPAVQSVCL